MNVEDEADLIGAMIVDAWAIPVIRSRIRLEHLTDHHYRMIYGAILDAYDRDALQRRYTVTDDRLAHGIDGLANALRRAGIGNPAPYVAAAQHACTQTLGWRVEIADRLDAELDRRLEIADLNQRLTDLGE